MRVVVGDQAPLQAAGLLDDSGMPNRETECCLLLSDLVLCCGDGDHDWIQRCGVAHRPEPEHDHRTDVSVDIGGVCRQVGLLRIDLELANAPIGPLALPVPQEDIAASFLVCKECPVGLGHALIAPEPGPCVEVDAVLIEAVDQAVSRDGDRIGEEVDHPGSACDRDPGLAVASVGGVQLGSGQRDSGHRALCQLFLLSVHPCLHESMMLNHHALAAALGAAR